ncbi:hypothetical protein D3C80_1922600 [compost metagenome]
MSIYEKAVKKETPEQREKVLRETLEDIYIQGKDYARYSNGGRMAFKAKKTLIDLYGDKAYESHS